LGAEGKIITTELQKMTRALLSMQDRVVGLDQDRNTPKSPAAENAQMTARVEALEAKLQMAMEGLAAVNGGNMEGAATPGTG